jgi:hypothetical protein
MSRKLLIMFINFIKNILLSSLFTFKSYSLPLPVSLKNRPIYYEKSDQLKDWSCGYNVLFNALNLENRFGQKNKNTEFSNFSKICINYLESLKKKSSEPSTNKMLQELAEKLNLKNFQPINLDKNNKLEATLSVSIKISYTVGLSKQEINSLLLQAKEEKNFAIIQELKTGLNNNNSKEAQFIHLVCHLSSTKQKHWVLASLVKFPTGSKELYIFDNTNSSITEFCEMKKYIDAICTTFDIT